MFEKIKEKRNSINKGGGKVAENQEKPKIKIEKEYEIKDIDFNSSKLCQYKDMGNVKELKILDYTPQGVPIKKISKSEYINLDTGELKEFDTSATSRKDNKDSLYKTFRTIRDLINTNFTGGKNEVHIVLTYGELMQDTVRLYKNCKSLIQKLKRRLPGLEYIQVAEPQGSGSWHIHMLCKLPKGQTLSIDKPILEKLWGQGFVFIKRLEDKTNIGAYLSAYLGDIFEEDVSQENKKKVKDLRTVERPVVFEEDNKEITKNKKIIKGGRLHLYPKGMNIFRHSQGIVKPTVETIPIKEAKQKNKDLVPCFSERLVISQVDDNGEVIKKLNSITYVQFNTKKKS